MNSKFKKYLFLVSMILLTQVTVLLHRYADWDLWARLAVGRIFFKTGIVLKHDIFAYTPTKAMWVDHEWGSGVVFYFLTHYFGDHGLLLLKFLITFFIFFFVFKTNELRSKGEDPYRITYYLLFFMGLIYAFTGVLRSQAFTYFFFALWLYLLDLIRLENKRLLWIFPVTMLIWANMHGGFLAGLGLLFLYTVGEAIQRRSFLKYLGTLSLSALVTLINPYGVKYWEFLINAVTMPRPFVSEWEPLDPFRSWDYVFGFKVFFLFTLISFTYLLLRKFREVNWTELLILAVTFYMSLKHARHVIFFIIASASYIYYYLYPALGWMTRNILDRFYSIFPDKLRNLGKKLRDFAIYAPLLIICLSIMLFIPYKVRVYNNMFPAKAVKFIQVNHLSGNLLVLFNWGGYALWKLYPQCRIAVDGRYEEVYPQEVIDKIARFHYAGINWREMLEKYHTDLILIPVDYDVYDNVLRLPDWQLIYKDNSAAVFVPKAKSHKKWRQVSARFNPDKGKYESGIEAENIKRL